MANHSLKRIKSQRKLHFHILFRKFDNHIEFFRMKSFHTNVIFVQLSLYRRYFHVVPSSFFFAEINTFCFT